MKKKMEDTNIDLDSSIELTEVPMSKVEDKNDNIEEPIIRYSTDKLINCLSKERVIVRHINRQVGLVTNPKHVLYGGMAETAKKTYVVPLLRSGSFSNVLTNDEKNFLEYKLGLEPNALSVHRRKDNFWSGNSDRGISKVVLMKQDNYLDLSDPIDYIKYKILLANKDFIAPSIQELKNHPKATYEYVIIKENDVSKMETSNTSSLIRAYKEFGKIEDNASKLKVIIETIDGRPVADTSKIEFLQNKISSIISSNASAFLKVIDDKLLDTKVIIRTAIEKGVISKRGNYLYDKASNAPLCDDGQEPTLNIAAAYLAMPKNQELKFSIEAKIK